MGGAYAFDEEFFNFEDAFPAGVAHAHHVSFLSFWEGLAGASLTRTWPPLHSSAARERVLKMRTDQSQRSSLALVSVVVSSAVMCSLWREAGGAPNQVRPPILRNLTVISPGKSATGTKPAMRQKFLLHAPAY